MAAYRQVYVTHVTCRLTAKNWDQLRTLRLVIEYGLPLPFSLPLLNAYWSEVVEKKIARLDSYARRMLWTITHKQSRKLIIDIV